MPNLLYIFFALVIAAVIGVAVDYEGSFKPKTNRKGGDSLKCTCNSDPCGICAVHGHTMRTS